ncbi:MAG: N-acetylmuramoyl-L-alanine amidase [Ferruginibacter sp.]
MPQLFYYLLKVILCSGILFGYYHLFLRNKIFHAYNRFYLLAAILLSLTLPLLVFNIDYANTTENTAPLQILEVVNSSDAFVEEAIMESHTQHLSLSQVALAAYGAGVLLCGILFITLLFRIFLLAKRGEKNKINDVVLVSCTAKGTPFSFFKYLFWNYQISLHSQTGKHIFAHELAHIKQKHSLDKVCINLLLVFFWINPFFWFIRKELNMIHEFIADKKAVSEYNSAVLASMMLQTAYPQHFLFITNPFFYSPIKRRLFMLCKYKNTRAGYFTRVCVLPLLFLVIAAFSFKTNKKIKTILDKQYVVVIDAGHGGDDGGAFWQGVKEKDITLALAQKIKALNNNEDIKIILTRDADIYQTPKEKAAIANQLHADLFISLHVSSGPAATANKRSGLEVYVASDSVANSWQNKILASTIIEKFTENYSLPVQPKPMQRSSIWVLKATQMPAIIIEAGYIIHDKDRAFLQSEEGKMMFANNILSALVNYLGPKGTSSKERPKIQMLVTNENPALNGKEALFVANMEKELDAEVYTFGSITKGELNKTIVLINGKAHSFNSMIGKKVKAKKGIWFSKNNKKALELYGQKAINGLIVFEDAIIEKSNEGVYTKTIEKVKSNPNVDASQRLHGSTGQMPILKTVTVDGDPIFVIDGVISTKANLQTMNPDDVHSVKVLKETEALNAYGAPAKDGAVLIKTKEGIAQVVPELSLSGISNSHINIDRLPEIKELTTTIPGYKVIAGTVYLMEPGFPSLQEISFTGASLNHLEKYFTKVKAGTSIVFLFTNVTVQGPDNSKMIIKGKSFSFLDSKNAHNQNLLYIGMQNTFQFQSEKYKLNELEYSLSNGGDIKTENGKVIITVLYPGQTSLQVKSNGVLIKTFNFKMDKIKDPANFKLKERVLNLD